MKTTPRNNNFSFWLDQQLELTGWLCNCINARHGTGQRGWMWHWTQHNLKWSFWDRESPKFMFYQLWRFGVKWDLSWTSKEVSSPQLFKVRVQVTSSQKKIHVLDLARGKSRSLSGPKLSTWGHCQYAAWLRVLFLSSHCRVTFQALPPVFCKKPRSTWFVKFRLQDF